MIKKDLILIGGGGHCKSCIDVIETDGCFNIAGIIDSEDKLHQKVLSYKVIASDKDLPNLVGSYEYFLITIGSIKDPSKRIEEFEYLKILKSNRVDGIIITPTGKNADYINYIIESGIQVVLLDRLVKGV